MFHTFQDLPEKELLPGFYARMSHTDALTLSRVRITSGSRLPEHHHPHEQITHVLSGELEMTVDGATRVCKAGDMVVIPSHAPHSAVALSDCEVVDVFHPAREDYK